MTHSMQLGVVMDPIATIAVKKDTTLALLLAAQARGWVLHYFEQADLYLQHHRAFGRARGLTVAPDPSHYFTLTAPYEQSLADLDVILMRKDPPLDRDYFYSTYILERAAAEGVLVVNAPRSLRDFNEKLFALHFPDCCPPTLVTSQPALLHGFLDTHGDVILKPLHGMGGMAVFRLHPTDPNRHVIIEQLTEMGQHLIMAQRYIPEVQTGGDKRILMIDGQPLPFALARLPKAGETRANLAAGGQGKGVPLTERDQWICQHVGPTLKAHGLLLVGLDVIGDYLTEINITSPTGVRELEAAFQVDISGQVIDTIERLLRQRRADSTASLVNPP